ncbi:MAG TPA: superoxide dismutase family protein [Polyangia bacterium]|nr:superoxide dismutase family protein [Polyangia bacterium]
MNGLLKLAPLSTFLLAASLAAAGCGSSSGGGSGSGGSGGGSGSGGSGSTGSGGISGSGGSGTNGSGSGGAGSGGSPALDAGAEGGTDTPAAGPMAQAIITPVGQGTITGTVTFVNVPEGVQVTYALENCPTGIHPTHIHVGTACGPDGNAAGGHWDTPRGEGIGGNSQITCDAQMKGTLTYTRASTVATTRWTIGGPDATNIVGHTLMVHALGANATDRQGCGPIVMK